jgi:hypothetical protein
MFDRVSLRRARPPEVGAPTPVTTLARGAHLTTDSRQPRREGSGPMEHGLVGLCPVRHGLGIPLAFADTPSGGIVAEYDTMTFPSCAFVVARRSDLHRDRLHRRRFDQTARSLSPSDLASLALRLPALRDLPVRLTTSRSSFQRSPLHSIRSRGVHTYLHVTVPASETGCQPIPRSIFVVFHHLDGLLLLVPLRILHRSSSHGVRGVSSSAPLLSPSRGPALRSVHPHMQRATLGWRTILAPGLRHPPGFPVGSPPALPPRPCCLDLEALLRM